MTTDYSVKEIVRKGLPVYVRAVKIKDLDKSKCSPKFLSHNFNEETIVYVKCYNDGTLNLRSKKEEYRIIPIIHEVIKNVN